MPKDMIILGIETSCDETAAAVVQFNGRHLKVLSNVVASQVPLHRLTGGVVPEVAAREHVTVMVPIIKLAIKRAKISRKKLDAVAVTFGGPSLLPALLVGVDTANALSLGLNIPLIRVHHTTGHIYANFLSTHPSLRGRSPKQSDILIDVTKVKFPLLALSVSGGHTELIYMKDHLKFKKIGSTLDDAAGETFDKTARILGLPYPGGPQISKLALSGNPKAFNFPRPLLHDKSLNFSFSGLKTAVLYTVQKLELGIRNRELGNKIHNSPFTIPNSTIADLSASIQAAIVDSLIGKTLQALRKYKVRTFTLGGGVSANTLLRKTFEKKFKEQFPKIKYFQPKIEFSTDNAAMIAAIGAIMFRKKILKPRGSKTGSQWEI